MSAVALFWGALLGGLGLFLKGVRLHAAWKFEKSFTKAWATLNHASRYRPPRPGDAVLIKRLERAVDQIKEMDHCFERVGDRIIELHNGDRIPVRVYLHESRLMAASIAGATTQNIAIESYTDEQEYVTNRSNVIGRTLVALPPTSHNQYWPAATTLERLIKAHSLYARLDDAERLIKICSLEDAATLFERRSLRRAQWRSSLDPDDLLTRDLKALLGEELFKKKGEYWIRRFRKRRAPLPKARLENRSERSN